MTEPKIEQWMKKTRDLIMEVSLDTGGTFGGYADRRHVLNLVSHAYAPTQRAVQGLIDALEVFADSNDEVWEAPVGDSYLYHKGDNPKRAAREALRIFRKASETKGADE